MATVLVDMRPLQISYPNELQRLQVQRSSAHNKSNDSVNTPNNPFNQGSAQNAQAQPLQIAPLSQDEFASAMDTANSLMAESGAETSGYVGTQLNVYA
jgi:hypothetical protein